MAAPAPGSPFVMVPLGPRNSETGRWCCGLHCGRPCPYGLKIEPREERTEADDRPA